MSGAARVDKKWQEKGIASYSTEAILGTMQHYGAATDEASFKKIAAEMYPMRIAIEWASGWRGTGQFSGFLPQAVSALWSRWLPEVLPPEAVGAPLLAALRNLQGGADAGAALDALEKELPKLPADARRREFLRELEPWIDSAHVSIEGLIDELSQKAEKVAVARRLAAVSDAIFPERADVVKAVIEARVGDVAAARSALTAIAQDQARPEMVRLAAVDALVPLEGAVEVFDVVSQIQEKAVREESTAVLYALHATTHLIGPALPGAMLERARRLVEQQHEELQRLTGRAAH